MDEAVVKKDRGRWSSRTAFYFAAIGAAVAFGNVWRFPSLSYSYGGGAFFIPYLLALLFIGIPLLILEIAFGQYWQTGDAGVFGHFNRRLTGVGLCSVLCGFIVVTYYNMLIAWCANAFFDSFGDKAPWVDDNVNSTVATGYFFNEIIEQDTLGDDKRPTRLVGRNIGYSFLVWFVIFLCLAFGIKWTGRITYFSMGLPIVLLLVFLFRAVSLEGSDGGVEAYIGEWDVSVLQKQGDVWSTAVSQIFFSLSLTFGIMTAFGSHCNRDEPAFMNSVVIAFSNSFFSFLSGFAVFCALGHLAYLEETTVDKLDIGGFSLVFGTWPVVLGTLPGGIHFVRLLFFDLFLLGIDSAFALIEASVTVLSDTTCLQNVPRWCITASICFVGYLLSLMYATDAGLVFLDVIDYYINFIMILVGFFETFGAGWMYGIQDQIDSLGAAPVWTYLIGNFGAIILASGIWFGLDNGDELWAGFVALVAWYLVFMLFTAFQLQKVIKTEPDKWTWTSILYELTFSNIVNLRNKIQPVVGPIPMIWCLLIKQFLPHVLIILFVNLAQTKTDAGKSKFGHYGGFETEPFQILGILSVVFVMCIFLIGVFFPFLYAPFNTIEEDQADQDKNKNVEEEEHVKEEGDLEEDTANQKGEEQGDESGEEVNT